MGRGWKSGLGGSKGKWKEEGEVGGNRRGTVTGKHHLRGSMETIVEA